MRWTVYALLLLAWPAHAEEGHSGSSFSTYIMPPGFVLVQPTVAVSPEARLGCATDEERVMRQDFSIGCAKDVRPQQWR